VPFLTASMSLLKLWVLTQEKGSGFSGDSFHQVHLLKNTGRTGFIRWNSFDQFRFNGKIRLLSRAPAFFPPAAEKAEDLLHSRNGMKFSKASTKH
jgi:hypothetical protein